MRQIIKRKENPKKKKNKQKQIKKKPNTIRLKLVKYLIISLLPLQIVDGVLTYIGVTRYKTTEVEGNILLRICMDMLGPGYAIIIVKFLACLIVLCLLLVNKGFDNKVGFSLLFIIVSLYLFVTLQWLTVLYF